MNQKPQRNCRTKHSQPMPIASHKIPTYFILLLLLRPLALSLESPGKEVVFRQFKPLLDVSNAIIGSGQDQYNLAITQDFLPLLVPRDIQSTKLVRIWMSKPSSELVKSRVENGLFISKNKVLYLWRQSRSLKLRAYVAEFRFSTFFSSPLLTDVDAGEMNVELYDQTDFRYHLQNVPSEAGGDTAYTLVMNRDVQVLKTSHTLEGFGRKDLLSVDGLEQFSSVVFQKSGNSRFYSYFSCYNNSVEKHTLVATLLDLEKLGPVSAEQAFSEVQEVPFFRSENPFILRDTGIDSSSNSPFVASYLYDKFFWVNGKVGLISLKEGRRESTAALASPSESPVDIAAPRGTTLMLLVTTSRGKLAEGSVVSEQTQIHVYKALRHSQLVEGVTIAHLETISMGSMAVKKISLSRDHNLLLFGEDAKNKNWLAIWNVGNPLRLNCGGNQVKIYDPLTRKVICKEPSTLLKNCSKIQPFSLSCLECSPQARAEGFELVETPTPTAPLKKTCLKSSKTTCQPPKYLNPSGEDCYDCAEVAGCSKCLNHSKSCLECSPGFGLSPFTQSCFKCSEIDSNCQSCHLSFNLGKICLSCSKGFFISKVSHYPFRVCASCPKFCDSCLNLSSCQTCSPGYKKVIENGSGTCVREECEDDQYFDLEQKKCRECDEFSMIKRNQDGSKTCEPICAPGEFIVNKEKRSCMKCDELSESGDCAECDQKTGVCQICKEGSVFIEGTNYCKKACKVGEYWRGRAENKCHSCTADNNKKCSKCEDVSGLCSKCEEGYFLKDGFCRKKCDLEKQFWSGREANDCLECQKVHKNCQKCANITGECLQCASGYRAANKTCVVGCKAQGEYWSQKDKQCMNCASNCLRCQDDTGKCLECKNGLEPYQDGEFCWYSKNSLKTDQTKNSPKLLDSFFDPSNASIVLVFDRVVTDENIPRNLHKLKIELAEGDGEYSRLAINSTKYKGRRKIDFFEFPREEVRGAKLRVSTLLEAITEEGGGSEAKINQNGGQRRVLASTKNQQKFSKKSQKDKIQKNTRLLTRRNGHEEFSYQEGNQPKTSLFLLLIENINYYKSTNSEEVKAFGRLLAWISTGVGLLLFLVYPPAALSLIQLTQTVSLLRLLNADLPTNLLIFMKELSLSTITTIPNPFKANSSASTCQPNQIFYRIENLSCFAIEGNIPVIGIQLLLLIILKIIFSGLLAHVAKSTISREGHNNRSKIIKNLEEKFIIKLLVKYSTMFSRKAILYYFQAAQVDALLAGFLLLKYPGRFEDPNRKRNLGAGLVVLALCLIVFGCLAENCYKENKLKAKNLDDYRRKKRGGIELKAYCFGEFRDSETTPLLTHSLSMALYGALVGVVVFAAEFSTAQCYITLVVLASFLVAHCGLRPHSSPIIVVLSITKFIILGFIPLAMIWMGRTDLSPKKAHDRIGSSVIALVGLLLTAELIFQVVEAVKNFRDPKRPSLKERTTQKLTRILKENAPEDQHPKSPESQKSPGTVRYPSIEDRAPPKIDDKDLKEEETKIPQEACEKRLNLSSRIKRLQSVKKTYKKRLSISTGLQFALHRELGPRGGHPAATTLANHSIFDGVKNTRLGKLNEKESNL